MKVLLRIVGALVLLAVVGGSVFYWNPLWVNDQRIRHRLWQEGVRSAYVQVDGNRIHYFEALPADGSAGTPLVLVHGLGSRSEDWRGMIAGLAAVGFHVYAPDLLGYGRSARPEIVESVAVEEGVVVDTMHAIGVTRADFDGWSMGGWVVTKIALDHPEMVDRLVLDDSAGLTFQPSFPRDAFVPTDAAGLRRLMVMLSPDPAALPPFVVRATLRRIAKRGKVVQGSMDSMESGADLMDTRLQGITQPTLIVWGTEDHLIPMAVGETMHRDIPGSVFEGVVGCGHLAPLECPARVAAATIEFLKAEPAMRGGEKMLTP